MSNLPPYLIQPVIRFSISWFFSFFFSPIYVLTNRAVLFLVSGRGGGRVVVIGRGFLFAVGPSLLLLEVSSPMYLHVVLAVELLAAFRTRVQFLAVHVTMGGQVARLRETRAALRTHVLPQTLVLQQVLVEKRLGRVAIVADLAHKRLGIRVLQHMRLVLGCDFERFAALFARVRGRVASFDVLVQHRQTRIKIVTETATEIASLLHVNTRHVAKQPRAMRKDLAAVLAGQILRRLMRLHVNLQRDLVVIALSAIRTDVRSQTLVNVVVLS